MEVRTIGSALSGMTLARASLTGLVLLLFLSYFLVNLAGIYLIGPYNWDDGAISLAYSKTLAEHGVLALTGSSQIVEGTSSLLFVFLLALMHSAFDLGFEGSILVSQLTAFFFVCSILLLLYRTLRYTVADPLHRALIVLLFGTLPMFTAEVFNGMEMSLFALLLAAMTVSYEARSRWIILLIPLLLLCRFESIFYLLFAFSLLFVIQPKERRELAVLCAYVIVAFGLLSWLRWEYFGDLLPNTIWAKMNPPYSKGGHSLWGLIWKLRGFEGFVSSLSSLLLVAFALLFFRESWRSRLDLKVLLVCSFGVFALITGANAGYEGRMFLGCLPLLILIAQDTISRGSAGDQSLKLTHDKIAVRLEKEAAALVITIALVGTHLSNLDQFKINGLSAAYGGYYQGRLPQPVSAVLRARIEGEQQQMPSWSGVTPANYRITGTAAEAIRSLLQMNSIRFMVPDIGGVGLCCENIEVIDSALLTNHFLARNGWGKFDGYLRTVVPDLIETHEPWSGLSGIYESGFFRQNYLPLVFEDNLLWIHERHLDRILTSPRIRKSRIVDLDLLDRVRYGGPLTNKEYLQSRHFDAVWDVRRN